VKGTDPTVLDTIRNLRRGVAWAGSTLLLASGVVAGLAAAPAAAATATGGSGASLPYVEVLAQNEPTTGTVVGPDWLMGQLTQSAVGREAVTLTSGQSVTFTSPIATDSIDIRYSIPDSSDGSTYTAPLSMYVNGVQQPDLTLSNEYEWQYGSYQFTNTPGPGETMHAFDEVHELFNTTYQAGSTFKLQVNSEDTASSYTINLADFEDVGPALSQPAGSVSVTSEGADPTGVNNSTAAFNAAVTAAGPGGVVWIPPGTYNIPWHVTVNDVTLEGAGMWYSTLTGAAPGIYGLGEPNSCGVGGNTGVSSNVHLANFALVGQVNSREDCDQDNGIGGAMSNSTISDIWVEHEKVGIWMDGPMTDLTISGVRIRDTFADGINLHGGVTNSTITDSSIRNTGDDGLALWADSTLGADSGDTISDNTVQSVNFANGIGAYGGNNNTITGNFVEDSGLIQGGGITVAQRFTSTPVGLYTISNNTMLRDGQLDPNWQFGVGALWFDGSQGSVTGPINVTNALIEQSPYEAVQWVEGTVSGVNLDNVSIIGTGTFAMQEQTGGSATFTNVTATGVAQANAGNAPSYNCEGNGFVITDGGGNSGVSPANCNVGDNPTPVFPPFPPSTIQVAPTTVNFGSQPTGTTSAAQTVAVTNPLSTAASVSGISVSGPFAQTDNCGSSIAASGSCTVNVTFSPTATGSAGGTLTVTAGGATDTVTLSGTGTPPGPVLTAAPGSLSFPSTIQGSTAAAQTVKISNTGTTAATVSGVSVSGPFAQTDNCSGSIAVGSSCTATVSFTPTAGGTNTGTLTVTSNANNNPFAVALSGTGIGSSTNLSALSTTTMSASSTESGFPASDANDANTSTYWESSDGAAYPQTLTANFGSQYPLGSVTLDLPPSSAWSTRTETLSVLGSNNGSSWTSLVPSAGYTFNPSTGNTVSFTVPSGSNYQYLQLSFTANTGWSAAQISEFEVFPSTSGGGGTGSATLSASPTSVSFGNQSDGTTSAAQTVTISNTGTAAASISSIATAAPFNETNTCGSTLAAGASCTASATFNPSSAGAASGSLTVTSNATNSTLTVALSGTGVAAPTATLVASPANVGFGTQTVGTTGAATTVSISNTGTATANVSGVSISGPFAQTNTCGSTIAAGGSCTASVTFTPTATGSATGSLTVASNATDGSLSVGLTGTGASSGTGGTTTNLALNQPITASSYTQTYVPTNANDGNASTYWEGAAATWPTTLTVNLGSSQTLGDVVIDLPPSSAWNTRTQTLSVLGSTNGTTWSTLAASATYTWNPSTGNTVTIALPAGTGDQYVQLSFTANNVQNAAQASEVQIYG
jgi:hypothetical protein